MKLLLWSTMVVCMAYVARCQQVNPTSSSANPSGDGAADGGSSSSNNTFDKNKAAINGIGVFFNQLNNDLLYLRNFIMSNVGEVTQVCGCDRSVLVPFFPPGSGEGPGGAPGGPAGVPPRRAPTSVPAAVNSATSPSPEVPRTLLGEGRHVPASAAKPPHRENTERSDDTMPEIDNGEKF